MHCKDVHVPSWSRKEYTDVSEGPGKPSAAECLWDSSMRLREPVAEEQLLFSNWYSAAMQSPLSVFTHIAYLSAEHFRHCCPSCAMLCMNKRVLCSQHTPEYVLNLPASDVRAGRLGCMLIHPYPVSHAEDVDPAYKPPWLQVHPREFWQRTVLKRPTSSTSRSEGSSH